MIDFDPSDFDKSNKVLLRSLYIKLSDALEISMHLAFSPYVCCFYLATFRPVICYAHKMVPIIFVAYGHVERLNILNACSKFASAIDRLATIPEQTQRISCFFLF